MTEEVVHIILLDAVCVSGIRADSVYSKISIDVVDHVRWLVNVAHTRCDGGREIGDRLGGSGCCGCYA